MLMVLVDRPICKSFVVDPVDNGHGHRGVVSVQGKCKSELLDSIFFEFTCISAQVAVGASSC